MTKPVSRRAFISTSSAFLSTSAAAASIATVPVAAATSPDAVLIELGRQFTAARAEVEAAGVAADDAAERFEAMKPQPPQALFVGPKDGWFDMPDPAPHPAGGLWYGRPDIIEDLRKQPRTRQDWNAVTEVEVDGEPAFQCGLAPCPYAQARADEVVAAYDQWTTEVEAAQHVSGYAAASTRLTKASQQNEVLIRQIALYPATTLEGLKFKARVAAAHATDPQSIESALEAMLEESGADTVMALSIVRDLMLIKGEA